MKSQTGARYLHKLNNRKDVTFIGIIKLANKLPTVRLASGHVKRVKGIYA